MIRGTNEMNQTIRRKPKAARCLFGRVDANQIDTMLERNLAKLQTAKMAEIKAKFDFDVDQERPIKSSTFEWEQVATAPAFYHVASGKRKTREELNHVQLKETKDFDATGERQGQAENSADLKGSKEGEKEEVRKPEKVVTLQKPKLTMRSSNSIVGQKRKATTAAPRDTSTHSLPQTTLQLTSVRRGAKQAKKMTTRCMR